MLERFKRPLSPMRYLGAVVNQTLPNSGLSSNVDPVQRLIARKRLDFERQARLLKIVGDLYRN